MSTPSSSIPFLIPIESPTRLTSPYLRRKSPTSSSSSGAAAAAAVGIAGGGTMFTSPVGAASAATAAPNGSVDMSSTFDSEYFEELINSDVDVDLERLREAARFGIPPTLRGEVWKYLLGVCKADKSEELNADRRLKEDFSRLKEEAEKQVGTFLLKSIRSEINRHSLMIEEDLVEPFADRIQLLILVYLSDHQFTEYSAMMVHLLCPLLIILKNEDDAVIYFCFCRVMEYVNLLLLAEGIENVVARFLMLFRTFQSELCGCFEDEGLSVKEWAMPWLQSLLSRELPLENLLRLWDAYFASPDDADLHIYVCLAILHCCKETLLEFEHSEIKAYLENLPYMDMDQLIVQAYNIRDEAKELINK
eukprot:TRINITY_DN30855_c0_g1_i1.p1 TRINITY_DN30855_c0_g1~~TRINITY_DN30855_c0_g1_i1.p1  ORF type:complete len:363 (+),score=63.80 TRINITY_DN30855_c0_g1_i1:51-1139(+)